MSSDELLGKIFSYFFLGDLHFISKKFFSISLVNIYLKTYIFFFLINNTKFSGGDALPILQ
ncbi:hypothetical protein C0210_09050 [Moraxella catarrhalis]|nr:hypothetical protein [Moraxella catarrhalis]